MSRGLHWLCIPGVQKYGYQLDLTLNVIFRVIGGKLPIFQRGFAIFDSGDYSEVKTPNKKYCIGHRGFWSFRLFGTTKFQIGSYQEEWTNICKMWTWTNIWGTYIYFEITKKNWQFSIHEKFIKLNWKFFYINPENHLFWVALVISH